MSQPCLIHAGDSDQAPAKGLLFAGSHRHSMAGTSGERGEEMRGNKREVQRDIFCEGGACLSDVFCFGWSIFFNPHTVI